MVSLSTYFLKTFEIKQICSDTEQNVRRFCHENNNPRVYSKLSFENFWKKSENYFFDSVQINLY